VKASREDQSILGVWWFTVDRSMLTAILLLMIFGLLMSLAASPPVALKLGHEQYFFVKRQILFFIPGVLLFFSVSILSPRSMRKLSLFLLIISVLLLIFILVWGVEINGSRRWIRVSGLSLQPSEFAKPGFVVIIAWLFAQSIERRDMPGNELAIALLCLLCGLLILQPDLGQTLLVVLVWGGLYFLAGTPISWVAVVFCAAIVGSIGAYLAFSHVRERVQNFVNPGVGDTFQTDRALQSFVDGGWLGRGPGEGQLKHILPDAHTDFIFSVIGEEYGIMACLGILALVAFIVIRGLISAMKEGDSFLRFASAGLIMLFGSQTVINMAVNIGLLPTKGMTFPFISYGGSSLISMSLAMGMAVGLTRRRSSRMNSGKYISIRPSKRVTSGGFRV